MAAEPSEPLENVCEEDIERRTIKEIGNRQINPGKSMGMWKSQTSPVMVATHPCAVHSFRGNTL
jgi:hypothetical protein